MQPIRSLGWEQNELLRKLEKYRSIPWWRQLLVVVSDGWSRVAALPGMTW